jgi:hypothetical protein
MDLDVPISKDQIISAEQELLNDISDYRETPTPLRPTIPEKWNLNDFGKLAFLLKGTSAFIHTTPETEAMQSNKLPELLTMSHGCIHIKPSDRDVMVSQGYLQAGVRIIVRPYRARNLWGQPRR